MKVNVLLIAFMLTFLNVFGHSEFAISPFATIPKDSIISNELITGLNQLVQDINPENNRIKPKNKIATLCLMNEFINIEDTQNEKGFFRPFLNNVIRLNDSTFLTQISYVGIDSVTPHVRAHFDIVAHLSKDNRFTFSSPMGSIMDSEDWKTKEIDNLTLFYKEELDEMRAKLFYAQKIEIDKKINTDNTRELIYCVSNSVEALKLLGINHKLDYYGRKHVTLTYTYNNTKLIITSTAYDKRVGVLDAHDYFHEKAGEKLESCNTYNHYMVCGAGYLYGGSYGVSWDEIKQKFKTKLMNDNVQRDWLKLYKERYNFGESFEKPEANYLLVTQFINALIVKEIEEKKGFSGVMELLKSGNFRKDSDYFFKELERITGINETNFNEKVNQLLKGI